MAAVWAVYFRRLSTDERTRHNLYPKDEHTWCRHNRDSKSYRHKYFLLLVVMNTIKPTFRALAEPELLKKCLHSETQNSN
jgi:hypothetical protein